MISKVRPSQYERLGFGSFRRRGATDLERDGAGSSSLSPSASSSFLADYRAGFSSNTFSLLGNIEGGDGRAGLDNKAKDQIARIMQQNEGMTFDEARKVYLDKMMLENNIGKFFFSHVSGYCGI